MTRRTTVFDPSSTGLERHLNKEALGANIKTIISFLSLHNYNQEVSTVILRGLNDYDFESIVRFLLRLIDPNIAFEGNVKEEFPRVMHMLGYPTQFPKSMMNSYYAPYYLPTIIAAIKWLTQVADVLVLWIVSSSLCKRPASCSSATATPGRICSIPA